MWEQHNHKNFCSSVLDNLKYHFTRVDELTGDITPDMRAIAKADLIVAFLITFSVVQGC